MILTLYMWVIKGMWECGWSLLSSRGGKVVIWLAAKSFSCAAKGKKRRRPKKGRHKKETEEKKEKALKHVFLVDWEASSCHALWYFLFFFFSRDSGTLWYLYNHVKSPNSSMWFDLKVILISCNFQFEIYHNINWQVIESPHNQQVLNYKQASVSSM